MRKKKTKTISINIPQYSVSRGKAAIVVKLISDSVQKNWNENKTVDFKENKYIALNSANVHSKTFEFYIGKDYRKYVEEAINNGDISVEKNNGAERYCIGGNYNGKELKAFSKCYTLNDKLFSSLKNYFLINVNVEVTDRSKESPVYKKMKNENIIENKDSYTLKLEENYKKIKFCDSVYDSEFYDYFDAENNNRINLINSGNVLLKDYSTKNRIYHPVIMMKKELRSFLRSENRELSVIDASSMNPFLLSYFIKDQEQKKKWLEICNSGEFYTKLVDAPREEKEIFKNRFMIAITNADVKGGKVKLIRDKIKTDFPSLQSFLDKVHAENKTVAGILQALENKIFRNTLIREFDKFHLPMHDGLLCFKNDVDSFIKLLNMICVNELGYKLKFTVQNISDDKETPQTPAEEKKEGEDSVVSTESVKSEKKAITKDNYKIVLEKIHKALNVLRVKIGKEKDNFEKDCLISEQNKLLKLRDKIREEFC